jgi:hypothetical protein
MQISNTILLIGAAAMLSAAASSLAADSPAQTKAREALAREQKQFSEANAPASATESDAVAKAREAVRRKLDETHAASGFAPIEVPVQLPPADSEAIAKAREVLRQKIDQRAQPAPGPVSRGSSRNAPVYQPLPRPESPVSGDKQVRLEELLKKYRADELTPEQYHQQRSKILAEP